MKKFLIDTVLGVVFWFVVMMLVETIFFGMTIKQSIITRSGAILINALASGINAIFIDWFRAKTKSNQKINFLKHIIDTIGTIIFQLPVYILILTTSHTIQLITSGDWGVDRYFIEIKSAFVYLPIIFLCVGGLYGILLNKFRKLFLIFRPEE